MRSDNAAPERGGGPRFLGAVAAGLGALAAAALFSGAFDGGMPKPARAEAAASAVVSGGGPARSPVPRLCFRGPGGEIPDFAPAGQHCS